MAVSGREGRRATAKWDALTDNFLAPILAARAWEICVMPPGFPSRKGDGEGLGGSWGPW